MQSTMRIMFTLATSIAFGTLVFFTAVVAPTLFSVLPIDTAGHVLDRLFPIYYTLTAPLCVIAFVSAFGLYRQTSMRRGKLIQVFLGITSALSLIGWLILLPKMQSLAARIPTFSGPKTPLINQFFMYHGISMLFNLIGIFLILASLIIWAVTPSRTT
ncbi:DUF4149 domain-containing protein [Sulfoacidibacillus thermotolerans]|uniref:TMEM205-like domain-containing protein n=1 Tax=Sulfoacidibacillus thermotolerans TaxID=1765684 RepID=A0A2U3DCB2_SULT2|nr:DUF4149 domain-containing protein [Sulfoacidibacillus thermotolerans]PWI58924.1 hypothetical protein BM613_02270 [Sulfoacidibacillus thermotolerans]